MRALRSSVASLFVLIALSAAGQQATSPQSISLPVGSATVADLKGNVSLRSPKGDSLSPRKGLVLDPESCIETGKGRILLSLQDGSQVLVKSNSYVVLS